MEISNNIILIIVFILFAFLLFKINELQKKLSLETFNNSEYLTDVQAIRTLSVIAAGLQTNGYTVPGNLTIANELYTNGWFRTVGDGGLFFEKYKGGWHMTDNDWMRSYNNKNVYCNKEIRANRMTTEADVVVGGNLQVDGNATFKNNVVFNGNVSFAKDVEIKGTCLLGNTNIRGSATIDGACSIGNVCSVGSTLSVGSTITAKNHITTEADMRCGNMYGKRWIPW